jgi:hypothetical protein
LPETAPEVMLLRQEIELLFAELNQLNILDG